ncbi:MAG: AEC family transporter [Gammaproteobacteria bacterium]|nr:MAG: AEC family transporter [Gammaproteobacteria bacterium]
MSNLIVVLVCLAIGLLLQKKRDLPESLAASLNTYVIYVALPALVLFEIHRLTLDSRAILPFVFAWLLMVISALFIYFFAKRAGWSRSVTGALMLTVPLGNTGFVGIPLIDALLGPRAIPYAILYDQFGTFIALNTYGSFIAAYYSGGATSWKSLTRVIISFPPFVALILAFVSLPVDFSDWFSSVLQRISSTLVPVVMVAVGLQWRLRLEREIIAPLALGLIATLFLTPAIAWIILYFLGINNLAAQVVVLEAAMPAMISAGVLAINYQLSPRLASSLVGYSLLLSLVTVWAWRQFI